MVEAIKGAKLIPADVHGISQDSIHSNAVEVLTTLREADFSAYLVGGCVRDLLLKRSPKDVDVATDARPSDIRQLFNNCRLVGRRFRLAHVYFCQDIIEVATFRAGHHSAKPHQGRSHRGVIVRDNVYGDIKQDAYRRDFTVNALYYDVLDNVLVDFVEGFDDLANRQLRVIGEPEKRYREDPVRMLRAIRFAGKLDFNLMESTQRCIPKLSHLVGYVSSVRLYDEVIKLFHGGFSAKIFPLVQDYDLLWHILPLVAQSLEELEYTDRAAALIAQLCEDTDERIHAGQSASPYFLLASLLWYPLLSEWQRLCGRGSLSESSLETAMQTILNWQGNTITVPKRVNLTICELWRLQPKLERKHPKRVAGLLSHPRFRAAYDLLALRAKVEHNLQPIVDWWGKAQLESPAQHKHVDVGVEEQSEPLRSEQSRRKQSRLKKPRSEQSRSKQSQTEESRAKQSRAGHLRIAHGRDTQKPRHTGRKRSSYLRKAVRRKGHHED